ncbi:hypothetical protein BH20GEM3_BH20GEM3_00060 [soil metagenome]
MWAYLFFLFVAVVAKLVLAALTIFLLFPTDRCCTECDGETLLVRMGPFGRGVSRALRGTLQRRWCPRCGWEGITRVPRRRRVTSPASLVKPPSPTRTRP